MLEAAPLEMLELRVGAFGVVLGRCISGIISGNLGQLKLYGSLRDWIML